MRVRTRNRRRRTQAERWARRYIKLRELYFMHFLLDCAAPARSLGSKRDHREARKLTQRIAEAHKRGRAHG